MKNLIFSTYSRLYKARTDGDDGQFRGIRSAELLLYVVQMSADRARTQRHDLRNIGDRLALCKGKEDLEFLFTEHVEWIALAIELVHGELLRNVRLQKRLALVNLPNRLHQGFRRAALGEVAGGTGLQHPARMHRVLVRGKNQDAGSRLARQDAIDRF